MVSITKIIKYAFVTPLLIRLAELLMFWLVEKNHGAQTRARAKIIAAVQCNHWNVLPDRYGVSATIVCINNPMKYVSLKVREGMNVSRR